MATERPEATRELLIEVAARMMYTEATIWASRNIEAELPPWDEAAEVTRDHWRRIARVAEAVFTAPL